MEALIEIDGKKLTPIREASTEVSYSRDYVTRLAREGKIVASLIGRQWFVDCGSLRNYAAQAQAEAELRKVQLSEERKREQIFHKEKELQESVQPKKISQVRRKAVLVTSLVLGLGLMTGVAGQSLFSLPLVSVSSQVKSLQSLQSAANANALPSEAVLLEDKAVPTAPIFSQREVVDLQSADNGILILPSETVLDPTQVFSDEVVIVTATSGRQSAVLVDVEGNQSPKEIPFVVVPVKTNQN